MTDESGQDQHATRRYVLLGAGVLGAAGVLTACSTKPVPYDANEFGQVDEPSASAAPSGSAATPSLLGPTSGIPVGGGVIFQSAQVAVTQPAAGEFKVFSAICTHAGCLCNQVVDGTIDCPCHYSKFKITDGAVVSGPAPSPLPPVPFKITKGQIYLA